MKFVEYDYKTIKRNTKLTKLVLDFQKSELKCVKLEDWKYCSAASAANNINRAAKRINTPHIKAITRAGEIFLVNDAIAEG